MCRSVRYVGKHPACLNFICQISVRHETKSIQTHLEGVCLDQGPREFLPCAFLGNSFGVRTSSRPRIGSIASITNGGDRQQMVCFFQLELL